MKGRPSYAAERSPRGSFGGPDLGSVFLVACFALFLAQVDVWAARQGLLPVPPIAALGAFTVLAMLILLRTSPSEPWRRSLRVGLEDSRFLWGAGLAFVAWGWLRGSLGGDPIYNLHQAVLPAIDFAVVVAGATLGALPAVRRRWRGAVALAFGLLLASLLVDGWAPGTFSKQVSRAAGFARNPNEGGLRLVLLAAVSIRYLRQRFGDLAILSACGLGVFLTLSRGAMVLLGILGVSYGLVRCSTTSFLRLRRVRPAAALGILAVAALLAVLGSRWILTLPQFETHHGQHRLGLLGSVEGFLQGSEGTRVHLIQESLGRIEGRPILGYGLGFSSTLKPGPHNQFLKLWLDQGLVGVGLFGVVLGAATVLFFRRRSLTGLVLVLLVVSKSFFSHNTLDDHTALLLLGLLVSVSLDPEGESTIGGIGETGTRDFRKNETKCY